MRDCEESQLMAATIQLLADTDSRVRYNAALDLGFSGENAAVAVPALTTAATDPDDDVAAAAAEALGKIGRPALPGFLTLFQNDRSDIRQNAVFFIKRLGQHAKDALPAIVALLQDPDQDVRRTAAATLGFVHPSGKDTIDALLSILANGEDRVLLAHAIEAIQAIGSAAHAAIPLLVPLITTAQSVDSFECWIRRPAVRVLGTMGQYAKPVLPLLLDTLKHDDPALVGAAISALGELGYVAKDTLSVLKPFATSQDEEVREAAVWAIEEIEKSVQQHLEQSL
jgi:HEAT repeat protein